MWYVLGAWGGFRPRCVAGGHDPHGQGRASILTNLSGPQRTSPHVLDVFPRVCFLGIMRTLGWGALDAHWVI